MRKIALIPARMAATRFPNKPLAPIAGLSMIEHVRRRTALCKDLDDVWVATCDQEIVAHVTAAGGKAILTSNRHERCTDRIAEAADKLGIQNDDIVINVQGDEPLVTPEMISTTLRPLVEDSTLGCSNLITVCDTQEDYVSPNVVKAVLALNGDVLYFSREPIPSVKKAGSLPFAKYKQLGIIGFRASFLRTFYQLSATPLEAVESVDMLRALEHGHRIRAVLAEGRMIGVDTPDDVARVEAVLEKDTLHGRY